MTVSNIPTIFYVLKFDGKEIEVYSLMLNNVEFNVMSFYSYLLTAKSLYFQYFQISHLVFEKYNIILDWYRCFSSISSTSEHNC